MEIIIGRNPESRRLNVYKNGKLQVVGAPNSVPMDVSRQHVSICSIENEVWQIKNLNDLNVTYVNGVPIESKRITDADKIELGKSRYVVSWELIRGPKADIIDISPLKQVWEWYEETQLELQENERKTQNVKSLSGVLSTGAILISSCAFFAQDLGVLRYILIGLSAIIGIFFFIRGMSSDSSLNIKMNDLHKEFRKKYVCPKCGHFMGKDPYDVLIQNEGCKYCKSKFKK